MTIAKAMKGTTQMSEAMTCKHRWEQVTHIKHTKPNRYMYICARCNKFITTLLKEKT